MISFYFLRHSTTTWNLEKRIQGRTDIPLAQIGLDKLEGRKIPTTLNISAWHSSPLSRALQTAAALNITVVESDDLIEMDWGEWEGKRIKDLRAEYPKMMAEAESQGIDLRPPAGESPRKVLDRLEKWAKKQFLINPSGTNIGCISHKGVIRAVYAGATGWDMKGKPQSKLNYDCLQCFTFDGEHWNVKQLNIPLTDNR